MTGVRHHVCPGLSRAACLEAIEEAQGSCGAGGRDTGQTDAGGLASARHLHGGARRDPSRATLAGRESSGAAPLPQGCHRRQELRGSGQLAPRRPGGRGQARVCMLKARLPGAASSPAQTGFRSHNPLLCVPEAMAAEGRRLSTTWPWGRGRGLAGLPGEVRTPQEASGVWGYMCPPQELRHNDVKICSRWPGALAHACRPTDEK